MEENKYIALVVCVIVLSVLSVSMFLTNMVLLSKFSIDSEEVEVYHLSTPIVKQETEKHIEQPEVVQQEKPKVKQLVSKTIVKKDYEEERIWFSPMPIGKMMTMIPHKDPAEYTFIVDYKYDDGSIRSSIKYVDEEKYNKFNVGDEWED